nr:recombination regulator RecX [Nocardia cyriacigeorgica]
MRQQLARLGVEVPESTGSRPEGRQPAPVRPADGGSAEANARGTRSDASDPQRTRSTEFPNTRGRRARTGGERDRYGARDDGAPAATRRRRRRSAEGTGPDADHRPAHQDRGPGGEPSGAVTLERHTRSYRSASDDDSGTPGDGSQSAAPPRTRAARGEALATGSESGGTVEQAKDACLRLLAVRARSRAELAQRLAAKGYPAEVSEQALDRLAEVGLIDDAAFAQQWVQSRHTYSGKGRQALAQELRRKGVSQDDAADALAAVTADDEHDRATELVRRKLRTMPANLDRDKAIRRLVGMLARRGYNSSTAYAVVKAELDAADSGLEFDELPRE